MENVDVREVEGRWAEARMASDTAEIRATVVGGPHDGHRVQIFSEKATCGEYLIIVECSCGAWYRPRADGCFLWHKWPEEGDFELKKILDAPALYEF